MRFCTVFCDNNFFLKPLVTIFPLHPNISPRDSHCPGYFQQLPSELLEVHLNVCHGLLRSTALRCGEAGAEVHHVTMFNAELHRCTNNENLLNMIWKQKNNGDISQQTWWNFSGSTTNIQKLCQQYRVMFHDFSQNYLGLGFSTGIQPTKLAGVFRYSSMSV